MTLSTSRKKQKVITELEKNPIITYACQKAGVGRATFYRWTIEDPTFNAEVNQAQETGYNYMSDYVESKLIGKIKNDDGPSIRFWLTSHHRKYQRLYGKTKPEDNRHYGWADALKEAIETIKGNR